jgi:hypothetical protein
VTCLQQQYDGNFYGGRRQKHSRLVQNPNGSPMLERRPSAGYRNPPAPGKIAQKI